MAFRTLQFHLAGNFFRNPSLISQIILHFHSKELITTHRSRASTSIHVLFLQTQSLKSESESENQQVPTVSYLMKSCGLSLESAITVSNKIRIKCLKKSDSVLELFRRHGFTEAQIRFFITKRPKLLLSSPERVLGPKIEFLRSLGISMPELVKVLSKEPSLLQRKLKKLISEIDFLRTFMRNHNEVLHVFMLLPHYIHCKLEKTMRPNISTLRKHGVPEHHISRYLLLQPVSLTLNAERFEASVKKAKKLAFNPAKMGFILAVRVMMQLSELNWERKTDVYRRIGWSNEEIASAFKLQPMCMLVSEQKIRKVMDFFVKKLELNPSFASNYPTLLLLSLEKRTIPRCSVLQVLVSKGLLSKDISLNSFLSLSEKRFVERFVTRYHIVAPEVTKAHKGEIEFQGLCCLCRDGVVKVGMMSNTS